MGPMLAAMSLGHFVSCEYKLGQTVPCWVCFAATLWRAETLSHWLTERGLPLTHPYGNALGRNDVAQTASELDVFIGIVAELFWYKIHLGNVSYWVWKPRRWFFWQVLLLK